MLYIYQCENIFTIYRELPKGCSVCNKEENTIVTVSRFTKRKSSRFVFEAAVLKKDCSTFAKGTYIYVLGTLVLICLNRYFTSGSTFFQLGWDGSSWVVPVLSKD